MIKGSKSIVAVSVIFPVFDIIFVALRFKARSMTKAGYASDDWVILAALVAQLATSAFGLYASVANVLGASIEVQAAHPEDLEGYDKIIFVAPLLYALVITLIKVSTILFYKRVFQKQSFHFVCNMFLGLFAGWFLAYIFGQIFSSDPVSKGWTSTQDRTVFEYPTFIVAMSVADVLLDLATLILPLSVIRTLHMNRKRKLLISGIFGLGAFSIIAGTIRLVFFVTWQRSQSTIATQLNATTNAFVWSFVELGVGLITACLPTLAPLLRGSDKIASLIASLRAVFSFGRLISSYRNQTPSGSEIQRSKGVDHPKSWHKLGSVRGTSHDNIISHDSNVELDDIAIGNPDRITVQRTFESTICTV